jgi:hypothetical protein
MKLTHRREQLLKLRKALVEGKDNLTIAVQADLGRREKLTYMYEIAPVILEIDYMLDNLEVFIMKILFNIYQYMVIGMVRSNICPEVISYNVGYTSYNSRTQGFFQF